MAASTRPRDRRLSQVVPGFAIVTCFVFLISCIFISLSYLKSANQELLWLLKGVQKLEDSRTYLEAKLTQSDRKVTEYSAFKSETNRLTIEIENLATQRNVLSEQKAACEQAHGGLAGRMQQIEAQAAALRTEKEECLHREQDLTKQRDSCVSDKGALEKQRALCDVLETQLKAKEQELIGAHASIADHVRQNADSAAKLGRLTQVQASLAAVQDELKEYQKFSDGMVKKLVDFTSSGGTDFASIVRAIVNEKAALESSKPDGLTANDGGENSKAKGGAQSESDSRNTAGDDFTEIVVGN